MHFSALLVTALAGFTVAAPLTDTPALVEERGELQERVSTLRSIYCTILLNRKTLENSANLKLLRLLGGPLG
jgi:hypothetical protein